MKKFSTNFLLAILVLLMAACQKELSQESLQIPVPPVNSGSAVFNFTGAPGNCSAPVVNGIYKAGTSMDTSNWIIVKVDVSTIGSYSISTSAVNGINFSATGSFTQGGQQTLKLQASGTPAADGLFEFAVGMNSCKFPITCLPGAASSTCKDCVYMPVCVGIKYSFNDTLGGIASIRAVELLTSKDTTIGAKLFKKITATNGVAYFNCTNGETTTLAYQPVSNNGNTVAQIRTINIKANAPIGTEWTDTLTNAAGQAVLQRYTIQTKGVTRKIGTVTFDNIIVVNLETGVEVPGVGFFAAGFSQYLYARDIGLVEVITKDPVTGEVLYHSAISSYFIP